MRLPAHNPVPRKHSAIALLKEGVRHTFADPTLLAIMGVPVVAVLFSATYGTLLPALAVEVLHGNATTNGLLQSARGVGSLVGTLALAALAHRGWRGRWLTAGMFVYPSLLIILASVRTLPLSMAALVGVGVGGSVVYSMSNALLQAHVPDALRGRVMSMYSMILFGGIPLGALWSGEVAHFIGASATILLSAIIALVFAGIFWLRAPQLRRLM
jgi:MFS family permease